MRGDDGLSPATARAGLAATARAGADMAFGGTPSGGEEILKCEAAHPKGERYSVLRRAVPGPPTPRPRGAFGQW